MASWVFLTCTNNSALAVWLRVDSCAPELISVMLEELEMLRPYGYGLIYSSLIPYAFIDSSSYGAPMCQLFFNLYFQFGGNILHRQERSCDVTQDLCDDKVHLASTSYFLQFDFKYLLKAGLLTWGAAPDLKIWGGWYFAFVMRIHNTPTESPAQLCKGKCTLLTIISSGDGVIFFIHFYNTGTVRS